MLVILLFFALAAGAAAPYRCLGQYQVTGLGLDCRYACDDPICHPLCVPACRDPVCDVQCGMGAPILCNAYVPSCSTRCPYNAFTPMVADQCPACETVCNALPTTCTSSCNIVCPMLECGWHCRLPDECTLPRCELVCEAPACEVPCAGSRAHWGASAVALLLLVMFFH